MLFESPAVQHGSGALKAFDDFHQPKGRAASFQRLPPESFNILWAQVQS
jgi:hypothetical protein